MHCKIKESGKSIYLEVGVLLRGTIVGVKAQYISAEQYKNMAHLGLGEGLDEPESERRK